LVKERDAPPQIGVPVSDVLHDLYGKKAKVSVNFVKSLPLDGAPKYQLAKSYLPFDINECLLDGRNP
jgi:hypothetical protein